MDPTALSTFARNWKAVTQARVSCHVSLALLCEGYFDKNHKNGILCQVFETTTALSPSQRSKSPRKLVISQ